MKQMQFCGYLQLREEEKLKELEKKLKEKKEKKKEVKKKKEEKEKKKKKCRETKTGIEVDHFICIMKLMKFCGCLYLFFWGGGDLYDQA